MVPDLKLFGGTGVSGSGSPRPNPETDSLLLFQRRERGDEDVMEVTQLRRGSWGKNRGSGRD